MLLKVTLPAADAAFRAGLVQSWHFEVGDEIPFGAQICDIAIDEFVALQRTKRASLLGSTSKIRRRRIKDGIDRREGRGQVIIRLTCAESGMRMREILVPEGGRLEIGTVVAMIGADTNHEGGSDEIADARISVDFPDAEEIDPFE